jgi:hypothetical protein
MGVLSNGRRKKLMSRCRGLSDFFPYRFVHLEDARDQPAKYLAYRRPGRFDSSFAGNFIYPLIN